MGNVSKGDTGELEPTVVDTNDLISRVDDLIFCWHPTPNMMSKTIVGTWICSKNAGGPQFEPSFLTNPQIKLTIHQGSFLLPPPLTAEFQFRFLFVKDSSDYQLHEIAFRS